MNKPVRVTITGAAGQIGYQLAFRIASGQMLGQDQPVILQLLEIPPALGALQGVVMELNDCAFPTLHGIVATDDANVGFKDADLCAAGGRQTAGPGHGTQRSAARQREDLLRPGQGDQRPRQPRHQGAGRRQSRQHQCADRQQQCAGHQMPESVHGHDAARSQPRTSPGCRQDRLRTSASCAR